MKTLLALGVTRLLRGNLLAAAITVTLHDVMLPIAPLLLRWEYDLGYWLVNHPHDLPPHLQLHQHNPSAWLHWSTGAVIRRNASRFEGALSGLVLRSGAGTILG